MSAQSTERDRRIQKAVEDFYSELDTIAVAEDDTTSTEWLHTLWGQVGDVLEGYAEWVQEVWEPLAEVSL